MKEKPTLKPEMNGWSQFSDNGAYGVYVPGRDDYPKEAWLLMWDGAIISAHFGDKGYYYGDDDAGEHACRLESGIWFFMDKEES